MIVPELLYMVSVGLVESLETKLVKSKLGLLILFGTKSYDCFKCPNETILRLLENKILPLKLSLFLVSTFY